MRRHDQICGCAHDAFVALTHIDAIICKAAIIPEAKRLSALEKRLFDISMKEFGKRAKKATDSLLRGIREGKAKDEVSTLALMSEFDDAFDDLPRTLAPFYESAVEEAYRAGFDAIVKKALSIYPRSQDITYPSPHRFESTTDEWIERQKAGVDDVVSVMKPSFNVVDDNAIATLKDHQVFWIGTHYEKELSSTVANSVVDSMVKSGFDRTEGAVKVQEQLGKLLSASPGSFTTESIVPHGWSGSVAQYYEGLAANTMTVSRTFGAMNAFRRLGVESYTISNPLDDRTCDVCGFLVDTQFSVSDGASLMDKALAVKDPANVKDILRWDSLKTIQARTGVATAGAGASPSVAKDLASKGYGLPPFHFRCRCVVDIGEDASFGIPIDFKLDEIVDPLRFVGNIDSFKILPDTLDGAHRKILFLDEKSGEKWLFKPVSKENVFRAYGDVTAARVAQAIEHKTPEVFVTEYKGAFGSIQKWNPNVVGSFRQANLAALTKDELRAIQKEHAFDWLVSNHDGHAGNLLTLKDGSVVGIDKGQLFKFFPNDSIAWTYNPNSGYGEISIYNDLLGRYAKGELGALKLLDLRDKELRGFFSAVEKLDDNSFLSILKVYSSERAKVQPGFDEVKFLASALERKHSLRSDLTGVWLKAQKERDKILGKAVSKSPKPPKGTSAITPVDKAFIKSVEDSKWMGKSLIVGGDDVRDGNLLVYAVGDKTVIQGRLTATGDALARTLVQDGVALKVPIEHPELTSLRKELNAFGDKILNKFGAAPVPSELQTASHAAIKEALNLIRSVEQKWGYGSLDEYKLQVKSWWSSSSKSFNVGNIKKEFGLSAIEKELLKNNKSSFSHVSFVVNEIEKGNIVPTGTLGRVIDGVEIELKPGINLKYAPMGKNVEIYSYERVLRIEIDKSVKTITPEDITDVFKELNTKGFNITLADKNQLEYQMFKSVAERYYAEVYNKIDWTASFDEKLTVLREWANTVKKREFDFMPSGKFGEYGWLTWDRFDISKETVKWMNDKYVLSHELYDGKSVVDFLKKLNATKTNWMSTEEKLRVGIIPMGQSPGADMKTGGASVVYTRVRKVEDMKKFHNLAYMHFDTDTLSKTGGYHYMTDQYGNMNPDFIASHNFSAFTIEERLSKAAQLRSADEALFEHGIDIGSLKMVWVTSKEEKAETIKLMEKLEKNGITKFKYDKDSIVNVISVY